MDDDTALESLPRMQTHRFEPFRGIPDSRICDRCGGPPQAHPSEQWLAEHPDEVR